ncbi:collagen alpha-1(I) chain-like [Myotis daubentonii]|uniref:collagen alpha-1(I) chain-like n=1 Tax=Myotis daubentonii TaxID=98922 RepID=UPI002872C7BA|nr:collagen alpha-1(I) chain-like [Myotis daubentonii]
MGAAVADISTGQGTRRMARFKKPRRRRRLLMGPGGAERLGKGGICPKEASGKSTEPAGLGLNNQQPTRRPRGQNSYSDGGGGERGPSREMWRKKRLARVRSGPTPVAMAAPPRAARGIPASRGLGAAGRPGFLVRSRPGRTRGTWRGPASRGQQPRPASAGAASGTRDTPRGGQGEPRDWDGSPGPCPARRTRVPPRPGLGAPRPCHARDPVAAGPNP